MNIPTELLRTFVAVVDGGSLAKAGERVHRTPSALSLQITKLEQLLGLELFERRGRRLVLTPVGDMLLGHALEILDRHDVAVRALKGAAAAGRVRMGLVQDFVDRLLPEILAGTRAIHPLSQIEVRVAGSGELRQAWRGGELDVAVVTRGEEPGWAARIEPMVWLGERRKAMQEDLPLVLVTSPCPYTDAAVAALQAAGRRHHVSFQTPSLSGVQAAIRASLGIGCRTRLLAGGALKILGEGDGLPALPDIEYVVLKGPKLSAAADTLAEMAESVLGDLP